jgi:hypothetical protein
MTTVGWSLPLEVYIEVFGYVDSRIPYCETKQNMYADLSQLSLADIYRVSISSAFLRYQIPAWILNFSDITLTAPRDRGNEELENLFGLQVRHLELLSRSRSDSEKVKSLTVKIQVWGAQFEDSMDDADSVEDIDSAEDGGDGDGGNEGGTDQEDRNTRGDEEIEGHVSQRQFCIPEKIYQDISAAMKLLPHISHLNWSLDRPPFFPASLKTLSLQGVHFLGGELTPASLPSLASLGLYGCENSSSLLQHVCENLEELVIYDDKLLREHLQADLTKLCLLELRGSITVEDDFPLLERTVEKVARTLQWLDLRGLDLKHNRPDRNQKITASMAALISHVPGLVYLGMPGSGPPWVRFEHSYNCRLIVC